MVKTEIANLCLFNLGISVQIANIDTDATLAGRTIRAIYDGQRDFCLRDFPWPFATAYATLALVSGSSSAPANPDWVFAYRMPVDCLMARRIPRPGFGNLQTGFHRRHPWSLDEIPFQRGRDASGGLIFANLEQAQLEYTIQVTDDSQFDPLFATMLAWRLAIFAAKPLSRSDKDRDNCQRGYEIEKARAHAQALNEGEAGQLADAEWISRR